MQDVTAFDINGDPVSYNNNYGGYAIIDQDVFKINNDQGLSVFFTGGGAPQNRNSVQRSLQGGLNYTGLIPRREKDVMGLAFTNAQISNKLRASTDGLSRCETTYELTYQAKINDYISIQPDFQYVSRPSGDKGIKNGSVFILRTDILF